MNDTLRYHAPARCFNEALPIGNGRLGAMIYGGCHHEKLSLNDDSLWAGQAPPKPNQKIKNLLPLVRDLLFSNDPHGAERLIEENFQSTFTQPYLPAGDLLIDWPSELPQVHYTRTLCLRDAVHRVCHGQGEQKIIREYLSSAPDQIIAIQITSEQVLPRLTVRVTSPLRHQTQACGQRITLCGRMPASVFWDDVEMTTTETHQVIYDDKLSRHFSIALDVGTTDGRVLQEKETLAIENARQIVLRVAVATDHVSDDPQFLCHRQLDQSDRPFDVLRDRHLADYRKYFNRVSLKLSGPKPALTTAERYKSFARNRNDPGFFELMFNYARYLMLSASRAGTLPANLQGLWNEDIMPPWWSNYTLNINTQMNYWMAEVCDLGDCHSALCDFVESLSVAGQDTAAQQYGCNGWVVHHQTDFRRQTTAIGFPGPIKAKNSTQWSMWPLGGAWLSLHLFEHNCYSGDRDRLKNQTYPVMKGAATFLLDWLIDDPRFPGQVTTAPSTSPENTHVVAGRPCALSTGCAMDMAIARALFTATLEVSARLGVPDPDFHTRVLKMSEKLPTPHIATDGRLMEFGEDSLETDPAHRHISHLFSLCPGTEICPIDTPELATAARLSLRGRGNGGTGWSLAWKARCWARLGDAKQAYDHLVKLLCPIAAEVTEMADDGGGLYPNLFTACPPFQIDANFGFGAALIDMLIQDHRPAIHLLPALPREWPDGQVSGLRLRHGMQLSMRWEQSRLTQAVIKSPVDLCRGVIYNAEWREIAFKAGVETSII